MRALKLVKIGNATGLILPKNVLAQMNVEAGDIVYLTRTPDGFCLIPGEAALGMGIARKIMKKRRAALRDLAK